MMGDEKLTSKLRTGCRLLKDFRAVGHGSIDMIYESDKVMLEAADEIERLQAINELLDDEISRCMHALMVAGPQSHMDCPRCHPDEAADAAGGE